MMQTLSNIRKTKRRRIPISLTPLIDVVFILLVFFMLASSFQKTRTIEMVAPSQSKSKSTSSDERPMTVLITGADQYEVEGRDYTLEALNTVLDENRHRLILLKVGPAAQMQDVVYAMDLTATLSLPKISLLPFEEGK
ncbi:ExbD/TolR family protein [Terasakiella pusilla]|uniref:ExbD/TolR family protein n=1 Tax=Terasakiella pusilla TaxID=64973 RepID=UPI0009FE8CF0|nr:biopolymer transporter ExbD [Terasakiella pusilla]